MSDPGQRSRRAAGRAIGGGGPEVCDGRPALTDGAGIAIDGRPGRESSAGWWPARRRTAVSIARGDGRPTGTGRGKPAQPPARRIGCSIEAGRTVATARVSAQRKASRGRPVTPGALPGDERNSGQCQR